MVMQRSLTSQMERGSQPAVQGRMPSATVQEAATSQTMSPPVVGGKEAAMVTVSTLTPGKVVPNVQLIHRCFDGNITTKRSDWDGKTYSFCLGRNQLIVRDNGQERILEDKVIADVKNAPILMGAELVGNVSADQSKQILVSYSPEPCTTTDDCGVGGPTNFVTYVYNLESRQSRQIQQFPRATVGNGTWNTSFTKVIFYPVSCGGAGCGQESLIGYDLVNDSQVAQLTRDKAAVQSDATGSERPFDVMGATLPTWSSIEWTSNADFRASIIETSGKTRWITGRF